MVPSANLSRFYILSRDDDDGEEEEEYDDDDDHPDGIFFQPSEIFSRASNRYVLAVF